MSRATQIQIGIAELHVESPEQGRAVTTFVQSYRSASYRDVVQKTLEWENVNGKWLITRETSQPAGTTPPAK